MVTNKNSHKNSNNIFKTEKKTRTNSFLFEKVSFQNDIKNIYYVNI